MPLISLLASLISSGGLPVIAKVLGGVLSKGDGPLAEAGKLLLDNPKDLATLSGGQHVKIALQELENEKSVIEGNVEIAVETQKTIRQELASSSWLARSWRPAFGGIVAISWGIQMLAITYAVIFTPALSSGIIASFGSLSFMWSIALGTIGVNIHSRTTDKKLQRHADAGTEPGKSLVARLAETIAAK